MSDRPLVFLVDDDPALITLASRWLEHAELEVTSCESGAALLEELAMVAPDVIVLDLGLPDVDGLELLARVRQRHASVPVVVLTADAAVTTVVEVMKAGAHDFLPKPTEATRLVTTVRNAAEAHRTARRLAQLEARVDRGEYAGIIGRSEAMQAVFRQLERLAGSDVTVLVHGESGTGKELVANALHEQGPRKAAPFVALNCAAVPEQLMDSELFGHERGAFTGAQTRREGRFEQAHRGTLFLDEIAELSLPLQAKLLRVLQERRFERVGGSRTIETDFRLVTATHRDLRRRVKDGEFREDLYFRLAVYELELPPLRARRGDLQVLIPALLKGLGGATLVVEPAAMHVLEHYAWPGNVRELQNVLQRALVVATDGVVRVDDLPRRVREPSVFGEARPPEARPPSPSVALGGAVPEPVRAAPPPAEAPLDAPLEEIEKRAILAALERSGNDVSAAARALGIGRTTMYRKLRAYGLR